jgi:hypothetical protein
MIIYLCLLVAILGAGLYILADKYPKIMELGRLGFWVGLLAFLLEHCFRKL